ncbi:unnamed protein product [Rhizoctonia solani]|uniref:Transmembrane protein n=1 Tax=Rhizoctonia solani TaxID=456999 RepID=A0A8H3C470_9AGAM|nr:unnamed protein product [Rhizoctonia solani]
MLGSVSKHPSLLIWHYWISLLRIPSAFGGLGVLLFLFVSFSPEVWHYYRSSGIHVQWIFTMATWTLILLNDFFILTIDMKRAYPYFGSIGTQSALSLTSSILSAMSSIPFIQAIVALFSGSNPGSWYFMILPGIPAAIYCVLSVCCLGLVIWPMFSLRNRYRMTWAQIWKCNTKDAFLLHASQPDEHHGNSRIQQRVILNRQMLYIPVNGLGRYFTRLFFRRTHPVERKSYAFARNTFAVLAIGILVFRAITSIIQTKSKIDTRVYSKDCRPINFRKHNVQVLVLENQERTQTGIRIKTNKGEAKPCEQTERRGDGRGQTFLLSYTCNHSIVFDFGFKPYTYLITTKSLNQSFLTYEDMPLIWLANEKEIIPGERALSPFYSTPWRSPPGYNSELEAGLVSRGFITSPIMRDLVLNTDPQYSYISLYPITNLGTTPLTNSTTATASIHITMKPGLNYLRDREPFKKVNSQEPYSLNDGWVDFKTCDFIEDYRSGTVLDVLGSVGGTKLINPFGLVGAFDTSDFSRRLHENYGREPTKDNPDPIQTAAFLRDFVIDFGPLATGASASQSQESSTLRPASDRQGTMNSMVPLLPVQRMNTTEYELDCETTNSSLHVAQKSLNITS